MVTTALTVRENLRFSFFSHHQQWVTCIFELQDEELRRTCDQSAKLQAAYGHYFDLTIVNDNLDETYRTVKAALETVSKNPQWVPVTWVF